MPRDLPGTLSGVSRVARVSVPPPADVTVASKAFGSPVRLAVLHELGGGPRTTRELMDTLGITDRTTMTENLRELEAFGVVTGSPGADARLGRSTTWTADQRRVAALAAALAGYLQPH